MNVHITKFLLGQLLLCAVSTSAFAQAVTYTDPAQAYNRLLIDKSNGSFVRVGNFKVIGSPFLFGEKQQGSVFTKVGRSTNTQLSYNTYAQNLEIYLNESASPLIRPFEDIDSFYLTHAAGAETLNLRFINAGKMGFTEKGFLQTVSPGSRFVLYKRYKSGLDYVSTNYVEPELRRFDLTYDYYTYDVIKKGFKKLKLSTNALKKEFGSLTDVSAVVTNEKLSVQPEETLLQLFAALNK